jgi:hypothetical protein
VAVERWLGAFGCDGEKRKEVGLYGYEKVRRRRGKIT